MEKLIMFVWKGIDHTVIVAHSLFYTLFYVDRWMSFVFDCKVIGPQPTPYHILIVCQDIWFVRLCTMTKKGNWRNWSKKLENKIFLLKTPPGSWNNTLVGSSGVTWN